MAISSNSNFISNYLFCCHQDSKVFEVRMHFPKLLLFHLYVKQNKAKQSKAKSNIQKIN